MCSVKREVRSQKVWRIKCGVCVVVVYCGLCCIGRPCATFQSSDFKVHLLAFFSLVSVRYYCWRRATEGHDPLARIAACCEGISTWKTVTFLRRRERSSQIVVRPCQIFARSSQHRHVVMPDYIHLRHNWNVLVRVRQKDQRHHGCSEFWDFREFDAFAISRRDGCGLEYNSWPAHGNPAWLWPRFRQWRTKW